MSYDGNIEKAMIDGILCRVREDAANLCKVAGADPSDVDCRDRAKAGIVKLKATAAMMLGLVDEVFG